MIWHSSKSILLSTVRAASSLSSYKTENIEHINTRAQLSHHWETTRLHWISTYIHLWSLSGLFIHTNDQNVHLSTNHTTFEWLWIRISPGTSVIFDLLKRNRTLAHGPFCLLNQCNHWLNNIPLIGTTQSITSKICKTQQYQPFH